jgi:hypothetical protein
MFDARENPDSWQEEARKKLVSGVLKTWICNWQSEPRS